MNPEARLAEIVAALEAVGLTCLIMGGHAVRYYGLQRNTNDYDLHLAPDRWPDLPQLLRQSPLFLGQPVVEGSSWRRVYSSLHPRMFLFGRPTMSTTILAPAITTEEMLALPSNGVERWLIRGQLREKPMTVRNRWHSRIMARVTFYLSAWLEQQPQPRGAILCGEAGCRLRHDPDTTVGIDVVYISAELAARESTETTLIDGVPVLVVEILSPSDTQEQVDEKTDGYLQAGVALVWVIDPHDRTVTIYRPGQQPVLVNALEELTGDPHLPGFHIPAAHLFA